MPIPHENDPGYMLGIMYGNADPSLVVTLVQSDNQFYMYGMEVDALGVEIGTMQNPTDIQWAAADTSYQLPVAEAPLQSTFSLHPSGQYHQSNSMDGAGNYATFVLPSIEQSNEEQFVPSATTQTPEGSCWGTICRWLNNSGSGTCGVVILCDSVPAHFKTDHDIKNINEFELVTCRWEGCFATGARKNFARHIRECHLNHSRSGGHSV